MSPGKPQTPDEAVSGPGVWRVVNLLKNDCVVLNNRRDKFTRFVIPTSGTRARVVYRERDVSVTPLTAGGVTVDVPTVTREVVEVEGLPDPEIGMLYLVPLEVAQALPHRTDLVVGNENVFNDDRSVAGIVGLARVSPVDERAQISPGDVQVRPGDSIVNLNHDELVSRDGSVIPRSSSVASFQLRYSPWFGQREIRLLVGDTEVAMPIGERYISEIKGLPPPRPGVRFLVNRRMVGSYPGRRDLVVADTSRGENAGLDRIVTIEPLSVAGRKRELRQFGIPDRPLPLPGVVASPRLQQLTPQLAAQMWLADVRAAIRAGVIDNGRGATGYARWDETGQLATEAAIKFRDTVRDLIAEHADLPEDEKKAEAVISAYVGEFYKKLRVIAAVTGMAADRNTVLRRTSDGKIYASGLLDIPTDVQLAICTELWNQYFEMGRLLGPPLTAADRLPLSVSTLLHLPLTLWSPNEVSDLFAGFAGLDFEVTESERNRHILNNPMRPLKAARDAEVLFVQLRRDRPKLTRSEARHFAVNYPKRADEAAREFLDAVDKLLASRRLGWRDVTDKSLTYTVVKQLIMANPRGPAAAVDTALKTLDKVDRALAERPITSNPQPLSRQARLHLATVSRPDPVADALKAADELIPAVKAEHPEWAPSDVDFFVVAHLDDAVEAADRTQGVIDDLLEYSDLRPSAARELAIRTPRAARRHLERRPGWPGPRDDGPAGGRPGRRGGGVGPKNPRGGGRGPGSPAARQPAAAKAVGGARPGQAGPAVQSQARRPRSRAQARAVPATAQLATAQLAQPATAALAPVESPRSQPATIVSRSSTVTRWEQLVQATQHHGQHVPQDRPPPAAVAQPRASGPARHPTQAPVVVVGPTDSVTALPAQPAPRGQHATQDGQRSEGGSTGHPTQGTRFVAGSAGSGNALPAQPAPRGQPPSAPAPVPERKARVLQVPGAAAAPTAVPKPEKPAEPSREEIPTKTTSPVVEPVKSSRQDAAATPNVPLPGATR